MVMIFPATVAALATLTAIPNGSNNFVVDATLADRQIRVLVKEHHADLLREALAKNSDAEIKIVMNAKTPVLLDIAGMSADIRKADKEFTLVKRAENPLDTAFYEYHFAAKLLRSAKADAQTQDDVPADWIERHERNLKQKEDKLHSAFQIS